MNVILSSYISGIIFKRGMTYMVNKIKQNNNAIYVLGNYELLSIKNYIGLIKIKQNFKM